MTTHGQATLLLHPGHRRRLSSTYGIVALLAGFVLIWGTGYWPTEVASDHTGAVLLSGLRVMGSALMLLAMALFAGAKWPRGHMLVWAAGTGLLMIALSHWGTTEAVIRASPGNGAIVVNAAPLLVVALGWISLREKLSMIGLAGVAIGFGGVILMVSSQLGGDIDSTQLLIGVGLGAASAVGWAIGTLILRSFMVPAKRGARHTRLYGNAVPDRRRRPACGRLRRRRGELDELELRRAVGCTRMDRTGQRPWVRVLFCRPQPDACRSCLCAHVSHSRHGGDRRDRPRQCPHRADAPRHDPRGARSRACKRAARGTGDCCSASVAPCPRRHSQLDRTTAS